MSEPAPEHVYESTACHHNLHDQCRRSCKFCASSCICKCHLPESDQKQFEVCGRTADVEGPPELIAERDALRTALEHIRKHQELISGQGFFPYSAVWRIADAALKSLLAPAPPVTR